MPKTFVFIVVATVVVSASADEIPSYSVAVAAPRYARVTAPDHLAVLCGTGVDGCTQITGWSFSGECARQPDGWRLSPAVSFIPYMYIGPESRGGRVITHELAHIDDIERSVEQHERNIASESFASLEQCRERATLERSRLEEMLRSFARRSFELRR